jgi:hypothetical protein
MNIASIPRTIRIRLTNTLTKVNSAALIPLIIAHNSITTITVVPAIEVGGFCVEIPNDWVYIS